MKKVFLVFLICLTTASIGVACDIQLPDGLEEIFDCLGGDCEELAMDECLDQCDSDNPEGNIDCDVYCSEIVYTLLAAETPIN